MSDKDFIINPISIDSNCGENGIIILNLDFEHTGQDGGGIVTQEIRDIAMQKLEECTNMSLIDKDNNHIINQDELQVVYVFAGYENSQTDLTPSVWASSGFINPFTKGNYTFTYREFKIGEIFNKLGIIVHEQAHSFFNLDDIYVRDDDTHYLLDLMSYGAYGMKETDEETGETPT
jgi:M6 family metalloprotease-like protein